MNHRPVVLFVDEMAACVQWTQFVHGFAVEAQLCPRACVSVLHFRFVGWCRVQVTARILHVHDNIVLLPTALPTVTSRHLQSLEESENIGYIIPSAIVRKLIDDYTIACAPAVAQSELRLRGFAEFPALTQVQHLQPI